MEQSEVKVELMETNKESENKSESKVLRNEKGQLLHGHPGSGRIKGIPNRFTQVKNDLLDVWKKGNGKQRFLELLTGSKADYKWAMERIIAILPKEALLEIDSKVPDIIVIKTESQVREITNDLTTGQ